MTKNKMVSIKTFENEKMNKVINWYNEYYTKVAEKEGKTQRFVNNRMKKEIEQMELINNATDKITRIEISVEWKKSSMWGYNPKVELNIYTKNNGFKTYFNTASGCGYCKESAAVAGALNESNVLLNMLYNKNLSDKPYGINNSDSGIRFASGGVGMSSILEGLKWLGGSIKEVHGKSYNHYTIELI